MCRQLRFWIAIFAVLGLAITTAAETYTLEKCIEIALKNNYGIIAAKNGYDATRWNLYSAYGKILPSISISSNRNENWATATQYINGIEIPVSGKTIRYGGSLSFGQSYSGLGLGTYANIKYSQAQRRSYYYNYINSEKDLILGIKEAYFNLIKAGMLVDVSKDAVRRGQEQLKVVQSKYDLGSASLSDVLKAKVNYNNSRLDMINAENGYSLAMANLNYSMGIDVATEFEAAEDFPQRAFDITYDQALNEAIARNPSYRQASFELEMAKSELLLSKANVLPSFRVSLSHSTTADKSSELFDFEKDRASYSFGLSLSFNIFNNFSDLSNIVNSKKNINTKKENLENTQNSVALEVKESYLDVQKNLEKMKFNEESVAAAQEDLNIVKEKYNLGAATMLEILDAEVTFKNAQVDQVQALFDYNLAVSRLEKVMGR